MAWVKEGRKYDLGAVLITQQPGSISHEILSQGDNWFIFHLLSAGDLMSVKKANAHFSDDLLSALLNEPIPGHGVFWSSAAGKSYPVPLRVLSFEQAYKARDPEYKLPAVETYATKLRRRFAAAVAETRTMIPAVAPSSTDGEARPSGDDTDDHAADRPVDVYETYLVAAIKAVKDDAALLEEIRKHGVPWKKVQVKLIDALPDVIDSSERNTMAYNNVVRAMNEAMGDGKWKTERRSKKSGPGTTAYIVGKDEHELDPDTLLPGVERT